MSPRGARAWAEQAGAAAAVWQLCCTQGSSMLRDCQTDLDVKYLGTSLPKSSSSSGKGPRMPIMRASMDCTESFWKST